MRQGRRRCIVDQGHAPMTALRPFELGTMRNSCQAAGLMPKMRSALRKATIFPVMREMVQYHRARSTDGRDIGYCHLEKLHNLEALPANGFTVSCFPHKIRGASAGWTRAVAIFED